MSEANCPDQKLLLEYLSGRLDRQKSDHLSDHIDTCAICNATISTLNPGPDKLVGGLQNVVSSSFAAEPECSGVVQRISAQSPPAATVGGSSSTGAALIGEGAMLRDYRLFEQIGRGGMGAVHRAEHVRLKRPVAIKLLLTDRLQDDSAIARFNREMEAVGKLDHANIVRATDAGDHDGTHFLVMELVDGPNLSQIARTVGPLRVADACELVRQAAEGLQHAYEHGLVHRDIKPSNLLLSDGRPSPSSATGSPAVKILDLGLALLRENPTDQDELTSSGQIMGTLDYMAPEQASDTHGVDIRADLYSLGCTLYHLLAGSPPFSGSQYSTILKKMMAHAQTPVPPLSNVRSDVPPELMTILDRLLAKEPSERYATPAEVAAALQPFASDAALPALLKLWRDAAQSMTDDSAPQSTVVPVSSAQSDTLSPETRRSPSEADAQRGPHPIIDPASQAPTIMVEPEPILARRRGGRGNGSRRRLRQALAGLGGILLLGIIFFVGTGEGRVELTVNHKDIQVSVDGEPHEIRVMDGANGEYRIELPNIPAGRRELIVSRDGFSSETKHFWITRNGERAFELKLSPEGSSETRHPDATVVDAQRDTEKQSPQTAINLGPAENILPGLIPRPARIPGIKRWNLVTRTPRTPIRSIAYSPDNQLIAFGTFDGQIRICDRATGALQNLLISNKDQVKCLQWSRDSRILVAGYRGRVVRLWIRDGELLAEIPTENEVNGVSFSPDGRQFAIVGGASIQIATLDGEVERVIRHGYVSNRCVCWHPRQDWIATSDFKGILRISNLNGSLVKRLESSHPKGCADMVWSPDGNHLATGLGDDRLEVWNMGNGTSTSWTAGRSTVTDIDWHPVQDCILSVTADGHVAEWTASGDRIRIVREMTTRVPHCGGYSPDGSEIFIHDRPSVERQTLDGRPLPALHGVEPAITTLSWDRRSGQIVSGERTGTVWRWENTLESAAELGRLEADVKSIDLNSTGDRMVIAASSRQSDIYDSRNLKRSNLRLPSGDFVQAAAWNSTGAMCAFGTEHDGVWLARRDHVSQFAVFAEPVVSLAWHHAEDLLAVGGRDGTLLITSPAGGGHQFKLQGRRVTRVEWNPHGDILAGAITAPHELRLWNKDGTELRTRPESTYVDQLAWDAAGNALLAAYRDGTVTRINEQLITQKTAKLHFGMVTSLAVHPEKPVAVSGDEAGTLIRWNTDTLVPDRVAIVMSDSPPVAFTASGDLVSGNRELFEREFVYVIEDETGHRHLLTPSEFNHRRSLPGDFSVDDAAASQRLAQWVDDLGGELSVFGQRLSVPLANGRELTGVKISLSGQHVRDEDIDKLVQIIPKCITYLDLEVTDAGATSGCFSALSALPQLRHLWFNGCSVSPRDIRALRSPSLVNLSMIDVRLTEAGSGRYDWSGLPNLELLHLGTASGSLDFQFNNETLQDIEASLKRLTELKVWRTSVTDEGLIGLASLSQLRALDFGGSNLSDAALSIITSQHPQLERLELHGSLITGETLGHLSSLESFTTLKLSSCERMTDEGFAQIAQLSSLEKLDVTTTSFADRHVKSLQTLPNLRQLNAKHVKLTDAGLEQLAAIPTLQLIDVYGTPVTSKGVASALVKRPTLEVRSDFSEEQILEAMGPEGRDQRFAKWCSDRGGRLLMMADGGGWKEVAVTDLAIATRHLKVDFSGQPDVTDDALAMLGRLGSSLRLSLRLNGTAVTPSGIEKLSGLDIAELELDDTAVDNKVASILPAFQNLRMLRLSNSAVTSACFSDLSKLKSLEELQMLGIPVAPADLSRLQLERLKYLSMLFSEIPASAIGFLSNLPSLELLQLTATDDSPFDDDALRGISSLENLHDLNLHEVQVSVAGIKELGRLTQLQHLTLKKSNVDDALLAEIVDTLPELTSLGLDESRIGDEGLSVLKGLPNLDAVSIGGCRSIGPNGFAAIGRLNHLKRVIAIGTRISDTDVDQLANLQSLEFLNLSNTAITDESVERLSGFRALTTLDVTNTKISEDGLARLRAALPNCDIRAN